MRPWWPPTSTVSVGRVLLRDITDALLPADQPFSEAQHSRFLHHMAALHAAFWGWKDDVGLTPLAVRYLTFSPTVAAAEAALGSDLLVPRVMATGWEQLSEISPRLAECVLPLFDDARPLLDALHEVPHTLVHGDWKAANLGSHADGRTVLLDFGEIPGEASPLADLSWYLALNSDLLPESKDDTMARYRASLEQCGHRHIGLVGARRRRSSCSGPWSNSAGRRCCAGPVRSWRGGKRTRRPAPDVCRDPMAVGIDYDRSAESWDAAAGTVYEPLGRLLLDSSPCDLAGRLVLDAGCGTGAVARASQERGARVVALDRSVAMLRGARGAPLTAVAGDVLDLPFGNHGFDAVTAGFVINQVRPADGLAELARITRPGGAVLASTWASRPPDPVKRAMEDVLLASGWTRPDVVRVDEVDVGAHLG